MNDIYSKIFPRIKLNKKKVRLIELFGGIGSQAKAFEILNASYPDEVLFEHYRLVECDKKCVISYNEIHNTEFIPLDITKITGKDLGIIDDEYEYVVTYSFPCQDVSDLGTRKGLNKGSNTKSSLLWEVIRLLEELKTSKLPLILIMENVAALENKSNIEGYRKLQSKLQKLGYSNYHSKLNLKDYGIPQNRRRCIMVSILGEYKYYFPQPVKLNYYLQDLLQSECTVPERCYLSPNLLGIFLDKKPHGTFVRYSRFAPFNIIGNDIANTLTTRQGRSPTDNYIYVPKEIYNRNKEVGIILKDGREYVIRRLTSFESLILMGFTSYDWYKLSQKISPSRITTQAGNSIGVTLLVAVFSMLYEEIDYEKVINTYVENELICKKKTLREKKVHL